MRCILRGSFFALCVLILASFSSPARAELADAGEAERVCRNWLSHLTIQKGAWAGAAMPTIAGMQELYSGDTLLARCYSIEPQGHVVVPALKELPPIQAYSDECGLDVEQTTGFVQLLREQLANRVRIVARSYGSLEASRPLTGEPVLGAKHRQEWERFLVSPEQFTGESTKGLRAAMSEVGPLLTTYWHQDPPFNSYCPMGDGGRCIVGCVATAMAQIMKYHNWPPQGTGSHSYYWGGDYSCGGSTPGETLVADFSDDYAWLSMPNGCGGGCSGTQVAAVSELCYEVGVAVHMGYGYCASGASTGLVVSSLPAYFDYDGSLGIAYRSSYTAQGWFNLLKTQIDAGQPVYYAFRYDDSSGHAVVCDGWRDTGGLNQYHINYGWGGSYTGWYTVDEIYHTYDPMQEHVVRNIRPAEGSLAVCCIGGGCELLDYTDCRAAGGQWFGAAASCETNLCETAACCNAGSCVQVRGVECLAVGGEWLPGLTSCDPNPCDPGACCLDGGQCEPMTAYNCDALGGIWHATGCDPNPCVESACCIGDVCQILAYEDCLAAGGQFQEGWDSCDPNPCVLRACCVGQSCSLRSYPVCTTLGGTWHGDEEACDDYVCLPDSANLAGGVLIAHAPPGIQYTDGADWCARYTSEFPITNSYEQVSRIDPASPEVPTVWYVLAAWAGEKVWCQTTFGLGSFDPGIHELGEWGACSGGGMIESSAGWPGPGEGLTIVHGDRWSGNYEPLLWFVEYVNAAGQIPLAVYESSGTSGFRNCEGLDFPIDCYGALGLLSDGVSCHPAGELFACCLPGDCQILSEFECQAGGGVWLGGTVGCDPDPCTMSTPDDSPGTHMGLLLAEGAPNPFWSETRIGFEIPAALAASPARMEVYDAGGRLVRTLVERPLPAGLHSAVWNGRDERDRACEAGIYFYRLSVGGQTLTRRLLFLK